MVAAFVPIHSIETTSVWVSESNRGIKKRQPNLVIVAVLFKIRSYLQLHDREIWFSLVSIHIGKLPQLPMS